MADGDSPPAGAAGPYVVNSVAIKLPPFYTDQPELWFAQAEAQFALRRPAVTDQLTRFYHVVGQLPMAVSTEMKAQITSPAAATAYDDLKRRLISRFKPTKWQQAEFLVNHPSIGDRRPSQMYCQMLAQLPDGDTPGVLFQYLFLSRLPADIRGHLLSRDFASPLEMAEHADRLYDTRPPAAVSAVSPDFAFDDQQQLISKVAYRPDHSPPRARRAPTPARPAPASRGFCFYHARFGGDALKCESPCSYQGNSRTGGRRRN